jgi:hypothetical protein
VITGEGFESLVGSASWLLDSLNQSRRAYAEAASDLRDGRDTKVSYAALCSRKLDWMNATAIGRNFLRDAQLNSAGPYIRADALLGFHAEMLSRLANSVQSR